MAEVDPNLIPPPSIGESNKTGSDAPVIANPKKSKLWLVVLLCVVAGISLGVIVYQRSIAPAPVPTPNPPATTRPTVTPNATASASPVTPVINVVQPQTNPITFPKAGEIRVYFAIYGDSPLLEGHKIVLSTTAGDEAEVTIHGPVGASDKMVVADSGLTVTAGQAVSIKSYDRGDMSKQSYGWIPPQGNKCGADYSIDIAPYITWATQKAAGQPLVSQQCWGDWDPPNDNTNHNYSNFVIFLSYAPAAAASGSPAGSASANPSTSPSSHPSTSPSVSPAASPSRSPSPSPSASVIASDVPSPSPSASARVTMPEGSSLPSAGIFEVTAGTMGIGLVLILLGFVGLLLI